jgi:flagellar motor switch protein FliN/FliY
MDDDDLNQDKMAAQWAAAMAAEQASENRPQATGPGSKRALPENAAARSQPLNLETEASPQAAAYADAPELDVILDISVRLSMELGSREISIGDLLQLKQGSVLELDQMVGQPLDVMVNGTLIAKGEVVQVNNKYGIRLQDIISQSERIKRLK